MITIKKRLNSLIITGLLVITYASANNSVRAQLSGNDARYLSQIGVVKSNQKILVKDELYFGLSKPGNLNIPEAEWRRFLNEVITPRFKDGLTVVDGYGQYLHSSGTLIKENNKLVILIYENNSAKNKMVEDIISSYKRRFQQESVLRVTSSVKVSF